MCKMLPTEYSSQNVVRWDHTPGPKAREVPAIPTELQKNKPDINHMQGIQLYTK